jgi:multidrug resistance protein, MATE family
MGLHFSSANREVLRLAIPSIFANITVPLVGIVDLAVAGRLGDASMIGGVAIATMLFDLLYWNMGFLRVGTGGMVAQAYGAKDYRGIMRIFSQGVITALFFATLILAIQYIFINVAFSLITCSSTVEVLARDYFFVRIWAAPATISIYAFKGFFIGMQNAISPMIIDVAVNLVNFGACILFAIKMEMGFSGIALGTVVAQYTGLILSILLVVANYKKLLKFIDIRGCFKIEHFKRFFSVNSNLFIRSVCFLFIYTGFTSLSAKYGDAVLADSTIMMKLMMLYTYLIDGFAFAGEALTGRFIGARDRESLHKLIKLIFKWGLLIVIASTIIYVTAGTPLIRMMTANEEVIYGTRKFLPWLWIMPSISCIAFIWDGIYIGATATKTIMLSMLWSVVAFFTVYYSLKDIWGIQALFLAFMAHLIVRSTYLTYKAKSKIVV